MFALVLSVIGIFSLNVLSPGASFVLTLRNSLAHGPRTGRTVAFGLAMADTLFAILALLGVAALLRAHAGLVAIIGIGGGVWIGALGLKMLDASKKGAVDVHERTRGELPVAAAFKVGITAGLANTQAIIFFSSVFLGGFSVGPTIQQAVVLAASVSLTSVFLRCGLATLVSHPVIRDGYLARKRHLEKVSATALFAFGMKLAIKAMLPLATKAMLLAGVAFHFV
jgi:threonine/homoserine/homoserine lactone efflux protein